MSNLEPDVFLIKGSWWIVDNVFEALNSVSNDHSGVGDAYLKTLLKFLLLLVDYAKSEVDLVGLFEVRLHAHYLRECFFGVFERPISII